ncbi:MAG: EAL domain-containing protein [Treponema sp.]|nr:EAL domain-containing protein [Treponema sp.]
MYRPLGTNRPNFKKYDIPPQKLRLEITESAFMSDAEKTLETIHKFRKAGFYVEIDDFGKGYSSLSLLKDIEVDMLKIDMDFLKKTKDEIKSIVILESIITLTKNLGIDVITEGVETKAQVDSLNQLGCSLFQGYYFSKPISVPEFEKKYS